MLAVRLAAAFFVIVSSLASPALARAEARRSYLITLADYTGQSDGWENSSCQLFHSVLNRYSSSIADVRCRKRDMSSLLDKLSHKIRDDFDFNIALYRKNAHEYVLQIDNNNPKDETDFKTLSWKLSDGENATWQDGLFRAVSNFSLFLRNQSYFRLALLTSGITESTSIKYDENTGKFTDALSGSQLTENQAYLQFANESERKKNYLRTGIEIGATLGAGVAVYYKNLIDRQAGSAPSAADDSSKNRNSTDDDSSAEHPLASVLYFQMARANGFNSIESYLVGLGSSAAWDNLEYHDVVTINDEITSPLGGYVIGQAAYQIACALKVTHAGLLSKAVASILKLDKSTSTTIDERRDQRIARDCKKPRWSEISAYLGVESGQRPFDPSNTPSRAVFGFSGNVVTVPEYGKAGDVDKLILDIATSKFLLEGSVKNERIEDLRVIAQVMSLAWEQRRLKANNSGELEGYDFVIGLGHAVTWNNRDTENKNDYYGTINIAGATATLMLKKAEVTIRAELGIYGDFAIVKSYALDQYKSQGNSFEGMQSIINKQGAYWGYGKTIAQGLAIEYRGVEAGWSFQSSNASASHLYDQGPVGVTGHTQFTDVYRSNQVWVAFRVSEHVKVKLAHEKLTRKGSVGNSASVSSNETRTSGYLIYEF